MTTQPATLTRIHRFPVKGLSPQPLEQAALTPDQPIAGDRRFALAHGASAFDPQKPAFQKKAHFLTWVRNPKLASLHCAFDPSGTKITVADADPETSEGRLDDADLTTAQGRAALETLVQQVMGDEQTRGSVRVAEAPGAWFADVPQPYLSIQNAASLRDIGAKMGLNEPLDWRRLRGNLLLEGFDPWVEMHWIGARLQIGTAILEVAEIIGRCGATHVNPDTAEQDLDLLSGLRNAYGHTQCGVYARVVEGGIIRLGDSVARIY
ncbi:MOSC domain-containing protein [Ferrovibrio sp.]|uniref:MOSC domain-containing protein n=1 Tax=Ferrovibrio sp. TaxID=1917215 RepID=UPI002613FF23|nr:MOSC domain-containing protein [Ferrovibrio sp.]